MDRPEVLRLLADQIVSFDRPHPLRIALDGIDAAGKTTLADELAPRVEAQGRPVIQASLDGFHRPRVQRYRHGAHSPVSYYQDSRYKRKRPTMPFSSSTGSSCCVPSWMACGTCGSSSPWRLTLRSAERSRETSRSSVRRRPWRLGIASATSRPRRCTWRRSSRNTVPTSSS